MTVLDTNVVSEASKKLATGPVFAHISGLMSTLTATELAPAFKKVTLAVAELCEAGEKSAVCT
ncbi:hypothetical protein AGMMS50256_24920 [Betaproteobacteria bacterium]|nr:hypothetical protein AGMMS50256_24920 [Betaproteobacteria bacterium]